MVDGRRPVVAPSDAERGERKASHAYTAAVKMSDQHAKSIMLEIAEHYEKLALQGRTIAAMVVSLDGTAR